MQRIKDTTAEYRAVPGVKLANPNTKRIIYTPPDSPYIARKISEWEQFVNNDESELDPLIIMALMHYQFEAIHPFADGNGRTGRILNVLYLVHKGDCLVIPFYIIVVILFNTGGIL
ncbi:MAG: Fic family protein [Flavisolibacter sp.]|nr:Fic family protein [Flavisolibacter sp.]